MAPQRWKIPISIVAVNRIDHTDWLDFMVDDLNHLSPHVVIFLRIPILLISQCMEMNRWSSLHFHLHTSIAQFGLVLSSIRILASSIPTRQHRWFTVNFTILKEQEHFFIWHLYEEANIFKLHICWCYLFISAHWEIKLKNKRIGLRKKNQHEEISGSNPAPQILLTHCEAIQYGQ